MFVFIDSSTYIGCEKASLLLLLLTAFNESLKQLAANFETIHLQLCRNVSLAFR